MQSKSEVKTNNLNADKVSSLLTGYAAIAVETTNRILKKPTAWKFVFKKTGRFFSSHEKKTIEAYAGGAWESFGKDCGDIEPMYEKNPYIVEGKA